MFTYKLIAVVLAYAALWDALSRWRVRSPERRLQLQVYGYITLLYIVMLAVTGGSSFSPIIAAASPPAAEFYNQYIRAFFAVFTATYLLLGSLEVGISLGLYDPSLPLLSRWWVRAMFEGPVWRLLSQRRPGTPFTPDEAEACLRHALAGFISVGASLWAMQVAIGSTEWGRLDPVPLVILLKALNVWLDARLRDRMGAPTIAKSTALGYSVPGGAISCRNLDRKDAGPVRRK